jgi:hypothetical protein
LGISWDNLFIWLYSFAEVSIEQLVSEENTIFATPEALDLLKKIFVYDHVISSPLTLEGTNICPKCVRSRIFQMRWRNYQKHILTLT